MFRQFWIAMLCTKHWQTETDWKNQKHHVESEFLRNRVDQDVNISAFELDAAEHEITKHIQRASFGNGFMRISSDVENYESEINKMHTSKAIKNELRRITILKPYMDDQGILRVYGRLEKSQFLLQIRHPMILPKRRPYTELVICATHIKKHLGTAITLSEMREKYWINGSYQQSNITSRNAPSAFVGVPDREVR